MRCRVNSANDMPLTRETRTADEIVARIAVRPPGARREVERALPRQDVDHVRVRVDSRVVRGQPPIPATLPQSRSPLVCVSMWRMVTGVP